jgi:hypothetical protein
MLDSTDRTIMLTALREDAQMDRNRRDRLFFIAALTVATLIGFYKSGGFRPLPKASPIANERAVVKSCQSTDGPSWVCDNGSARISPQKHRTT